MSYLRYYPFLITTALLVLAGVFHSVGFAYATVCLLTVIALRDSFSQYYEQRHIKTGVPDEVKKAIGDLNARITTIEAGIARRGF